MIRVPISEFLEIYLGAVLLWTFVVWLSANWIKRRREVRAQRLVIECSICGHAFRDASQNPLTRCPSCGRLNERALYSGL